MERAELKARRREAGHPRRVRAEGDVPGILYGGGLEPVPVRVSRTELQRLAATGQLHGLVDLVLEGEAKPLPVLVREVQREPVKGEVLHVDFFRVAPDRPVEVTVPVHLVGVEAVEERGGIVQHQLHQLEITCLPRDVPEAITVDVGGLGVGDSLTVGEIAPPPGVRIRHAPDEVVAVVVEAPAAEAAQGEGEASTGAGA